MKCISPCWDILRIYEEIKIKCYHLNLTSPFYCSELNFTILYAAKSNQAGKRIS